MISKKQTKRLRRPNTVLKQKGYGGWMKKKNLNQQIRKYILRSW